MFELSAYVRYITRFTEESFAALIAIIFIFESFNELFDIRNKENELDLQNSTNETAGICFKFQDLVMNKSIICDQNNSSNFLLSGEFSSSISKNESKSNPEIFYFSITLFVLTFLLSYTLDRFKTTPFLPYKVY